MVNLSILEQRLHYKLPSVFAEEISEEISRFEIEWNRMSEEEDKIGQARLADSEVRMLKTTNQHGDDGLTVVQWQSIKAKAIKNGIIDWTSKVDGNLTYHENLSLMEVENNGR